MCHIAAGFAAWSSNQGREPAEMAAFLANGHRARDEQNTDKLRALVSRSLVEFFAKSRHKKYGRNLEPLDLAAVRGEFLKP